MTQGLKRVKIAPEPIRHPEDVARLRALLNGMGYDADDQDIQRVYSDWSEENYAAGWMSLTAFSEGELRGILRQCFTLEQESPNNAP